jgi:hypothetical protein
MYNVYLYDRVSDKLKAKEFEQKNYIKTISAQVKIREKLAKKNKITVRDRILQMSEKPVPISRKSYSVNLPEFKGESFIRHRPKDAKERIKDAEFNNTWLDTIPILPSPHNFRPRFKEKEIHSDMKFRPKDRYERVEETWTSQQGTLVSSWEVNSKQQSRNYTSVTERFPNRFKRSYYKTVESLALNQNSTIFPAIKTGPDAKNEVNDKNLVDVAKELMEKCKLKPLKDEILSPYASRSASLPA